MPRFKPYNYDQNAMVVINYQDQLQPSTFEHAVHYLQAQARSTSFSWVLKWLNADIKITQPDDRLSK
ncbi:hypothetical protein HaloA020_20900 [Halomonas sp. A020]|uniref:hypothetical protein n=1 Tax=Halomonas sp. A020 TaxID=2717374 RepID=UPI00248F89AD|nr:hypothetical protein [Halomonas sp. A020]BCB61389.1 hypothetical protein HaloA020_20900 [Halomonas sp. A020]